MTTSLNGADTVERVLRRQAGVVSRAQALTAGTTAREIDRLVDGLHKVKQQLG